MNNDTRLEALKLRGYSHAHAQFLLLVLLHSGYFLRRQHAAFLGVSDGARTTEFVHSLVGRHLARRHVFDRQTHVYHAVSPMLYEAIGEPNSRLRRPVAPALVTQRLMTLDVLIAHRGMPCLATGDEKMEFFTERHGVPADDLPGRLYCSETPGTPPTKRYFVDRVPILIGASSLTFVYVSGWNPVGAFAAFLNAYAPLLRRLQHTRVLFCTPDEGVVARARRMCERRFGAPPTRPVDSGHTERVLAHFEARRRYEQRQFRTFTAGELAQLRADLDRFTGPVYEDWYERWCMAGVAAAAPVDLEKVTSHDHGFVQFEPHILLERYPFVGRIQEAA
jgi:hypothetical protein